MNEIIAAVSFAVYFTEIAQLHLKLRINFKPFSCAPCLAAWSGLAMYMMPDTIVNGFMIMFASGVLAPIVVQLITYIYSKFQ